MGVGRGFVGNADGAKWQTVGAAQRFRVRRTHDLSQNVRGQTMMARSAEIHDSGK